VWPGVRRRGRYTGQLETDDTRDFNVWNRPWVAKAACLSASSAAEWPERPRIANPTAPRSPWQNLYCERVIGSIRRECLDHVIVLNERHLFRILSDYFDYDHTCRPHLSLDRNSPTPRAVELPSPGQAISTAQVGGLHHRYSRVA